MGKMVVGQFTLLVGSGVAVAGVSGWLSLSFLILASSLAWHDGQAGIV